MKKLFLDIIYFIACGFGAGFLPIIPGTFGTIVGVGIYYLMTYLSLSAYISITIIMFTAGVFICNIAAAKYKAKGEAIDHPTIVWDEIVGYLITMACSTYNWKLMILGFFVFRFLDVVKPWPINKINDYMKNGLGIMLDDAVAGIYGNILLFVIAMLLNYYDIY